MSSQTVLSLIGIAVGLIGLGGLVVLGLRGRVLKDDLDLTTRRLDESDKELERKDRRLHDLEVEHDALRASDAGKTLALARIGEQAASGAELARLAEVIQEYLGLSRDHEQEATKRHAATIRSLREMRETLQERLPEPRVEN